MMAEIPGYNERLFSKGLRSQVHLARFAWLKEMVTRHFPNNPLRVVELGCYDGRSIEWLPSEPSLYDGFDANWEGGLDIGQEYFAEKRNIRFHECATPEEMKTDSSGYDIGISLETMEHIPPGMVEDYLDVFARAVTGAIFITIPNEIGVPFLVKYLAKKMIYRDSKDEPYSFPELLAATIGFSHKVHRNEHKGFDYRRFIEQVERKFSIQSVQGVPYSWMPMGISFTIGIVATPKKF